jgi:HEPN domain-containing protein
MKATSQEKRDYWLDLAQYDFETAQVMLDGGRFLYVGFMCHQVVEKSLKASIWELTQREPEYTHSLSKLLNSSGLNDEIPNHLADLLDVLEPLNIEARYPTYKERLLKSLSLSRSTKLIQDTEELFSWIKTKLSI